jgi:hypothetical protein
MERSVNILKRAILDGFVFDSQDSFEDIILQAEQWFDDYPADIIDTPDYFDGRNLSWNDKKGFSREVSGEFFTYEDERRARQRGETSILVDRFFDTDANIVELYIEIE